MRGEVDEVAEASSECILEVQLSPSPHSRSVMSAAAAIILRKERDIVNTFRGAGATSANAARDPGELGIERRVPFRLLEKHAVLRDAGDGRFYVDEPSWNALRSMRHRLAFVLIALVVIVFIAGGFFASRQ